LGWKKIPEKSEDEDENDDEEEDGQNFIFKQALTASGFAPAQSRLQAGAPV
jgi:hypothetical protein